LSLLQKRNSERVPPPTAYTEFKEASARIIIARLSFCKPCEKYYIETERNNLWRCRACLPCQNLEALISNANGYCPMRKWMRE